MGCIGRLRFVTPRGRSYATGFLVAPGMVMTNHHVFPEAAAAQGASIEFGYQYNLAGQLPATVEFDLAPGEFFVADKTLDFAAVAVAGRSTQGDELSPRGYLRMHPETGKVKEGEFVTIVQHPDGEPVADRAARE